MSVKLNSETGETWTSQPGYIQAVLEKFGLEYCKPVNTPVTPGTKLLKATEQSNKVDATLYQSVVGSLLYLSGWTRPDITFAVCSILKCSITIFDLQTGTFRKVEILIRGVDSAMVNKTAAGTMWFYHGI